MNNQHYMKTIVCFFMLGLLLYTTPAVAEDPENTPPSAGRKQEKTKDKNDVVAKVNATEIKESELSEAMNATMAQNPQLYSMMASEEGKKALRKRALDRVISTELLNQEGMKIKIKDLGQQVDKAYEDIRAKFPKEEAFQKALKQRNMTKKDLRKQIEKGIRIRSLIDDKVKKNISISEADVKSFYDTNKDKFVDKEEVKASHILIKVAKDADKADEEKALKKIKELLKRAKAGEDFAKLAKENSEDPSAAQNSGDLGYFSREQMVPEFSKAAFALKKGEISDPVKTTFGYHIIKFEDKKAERAVPYEEVNDKIAEYLKGRAVQSKVADYVESLKKTAKIEILLK